ncbi:hypothetical protein Pcinc_037268 [Petrolisthes cinctipes]|uniref:RUS family member 1 n=1 Tax=Petrolisthes cinctipes TaxID=88211 RepID=A0AAE1EP40_PETCI|nr:hypothetical protein Pcinc_037268 [Petrolisthes cinctipes]
MAESKALLYREKKGQSARHNTYVFQDSTNSFIEVTTHEERQTVNRLQDRGGRWLRDVFLPQGYPESVSPDYLRYQFWDSLQAYCSSIAGALSLQATLTGLGVGEGTATPLAATLTWLLKDGSGMIASIAFAYWRGSQLDCNSKQWRLFADVANDAKHFVQLLGPLLPVPFLVVMCVSAVMLALVGVAGGATRAAFSQHQARRENMADVSAKDGSQETMVNLAALITSITLLPTITASLLLTWVTFVVCVVLHLYTNYRAVRSVRMESLNRPRLLSALHSWFSSASVPTVEEANMQEPLLFGPAFIPAYFPHGFSLYLACSLQWALHRCLGREGKVQELYTTIMANFDKDNYLLCGNLREKQLHVIYRTGITSRQELEAVFTAYLCVLNFVHASEGCVLSAEYVAHGIREDTPDSEIILASKQLAKKIFPAFRDSLAGKGWHIHKLLLAADEWRLT